MGAVAISPDAGLTSPCPGLVTLQAFSAPAPTRMPWVVLQRITAVLAAWPAAAFSTGQPDATGAGPAPFNSSVYPPAAGCVVGQTVL